MTLAILSSPTYALDERNVANWSAAQERGITTYPFELQAEEPGDYVVRTYLQFLWLPESIMSLNYLIPSLQRVNAPSGSSKSMPHPMHAILEPLLLTTPSVNKKYRSELARILSNGGGAGEMEEAMMWYAVEHEKPLDDAGGKSPQKHGRDDEGPWTNAKWREQYMERMEGREVQIQILLYLFKFSLPGPPPPPAESNNIESKFKKRKRSAISSPSEPILTAEDHLESFMDKLAMWQLVERVDGALNSTNTGQTKIDKNKKNQDDRDWTQIFAEDVVEPQFKSKLPKVCKLLRSKVFPTPPFSDTESDTPTTRKASPEPIVSTSPTTCYVPTGIPLKKSLSRVPSTSISRAPSASLRAHSLSRHLSSPTHPKSPSTFDPSRTFVRSRSRSLSLSLAKEQEARAAAAANAAEQHTKKKLNREVSMSRVFKSKGKGKRRGVSKAEGRKKGEVAGSATVEIEVPKAEKRHKEDKGVTLVEETPIKARVSFGTVNSQPRVPIAPPNFGTTGVQRKSSHLAVNGINNDDEEEEEEWIMDSSPAIVAFDPSVEKTKERERASSASSGIVATEESNGAEWPTP